MNQKIIGLLSVLILILLIIWGYNSLYHSKVVSDVNSNVNNQVEEIDTSDWAEYNDFIDKINFKYPPDYQPKENWLDETGYITIYTPVDLAKTDGTEVFPLAVIYSAEAYGKLGGEKFDSLDEAEKVYASKKENNGTILSIERFKLNSKDALKIIRLGDMIDETIVISMPHENLLVVDNLSGQEDIFKALIYTID